MPTTPSRRRRQDRTVKQLRRLHEALAQAAVSPIEQRRAEDRIREERHEARAKTVYATTPVEQRRRRSAAELHAQRQEDEHQWSAEHRGSPPRATVTTPGENMDTKASGRRRPNK